MPLSYKCTPTRTSESPSLVARHLALPVRGRTKPKLIIGRREWLALPELGIDMINAKVDTGAYTSSLHAEHIESYSTGGIDYVSFLTHNHHGDEVRCSAPLVQRKKIKSSTGLGRMRYIIRAHAQIFGGFQWEILFSLANRSVMKCPLLLGRRALSGYFVVDTQTSHLFGNITKFTGKTHHKKS
jgi:hypothetical protein